MKTTSNPLVAAFLSDVQSFIASSGMSPTAFGAWAIGDPNFVRDLEAGREPRWKTISAVREKMSEGEAPSQKAQGTP